MSEYTHRPDYGAEHLKATAGRNTFGATFLSCFLITALFLTPKIIEWFQKEEASKVVKVKAKKVVDYAELSAPPPIDLEKVEAEKVKPKVKVKIVKFLQPVAKKDEEVPEEEFVPTMEEMQSSQIGTFDQEGIDSIMMSQNEELELDLNPEPESEPFTYVEVMPEFKGGEQALLSYLAANISYPEFAKDAGLEGTVYIRFVIEADGSITQVEVIRGVHPQLDKEAVSVIADMPKWKPGQQNGQYVRVSYTIPVRFRLKERM